MKTKKNEEENRNKWNCPHCKVGQNSKRDGGNENCFHCGSCWYVECALEFAEMEKQAEKRGYQKGYRAGRKKCYLCEKEPASVCEECATEAFH